MPDTIDYNTEKQRITTRRELNRFINSIKRFQKVGSENLTFLENGQPISEWEKRELSIQVRTAKNKLNREIKSVDKNVQPYTTQKELTAIVNLEALNNWQNLKR